METVLSKRKSLSINTSRQTKEYKKLSKAGKWMHEHPNGIFIIVDRKAVNK
jgi:hypothetical protein